MALGSPSWISVYRYASTVSVGWTGGGHTCILVEVYTSMSVDMGVQKKPSLGAALNQAAGKRAPESLPVDPDPVVVAPEAAPAPKPRTKASSRSGTKMIGGHFPPEVSKQLKLIAVDQDKSLQSLLEEAIGDLFEKYGKPRLL